MEPTITVLKSKIHRATVTAVDVDYEGSCLIDKWLMEEAEICEYEQIHIYNVINGKRFTTYAMESAQVGGIGLNGAATLKGNVGDKIIICTYHQVVYRGLPFFPTIVFVGAKNKIVQTIKAGKEFYL